MYLKDIDQHGITRENQRFFINTTEVAGVQSVQVNIPKGLELLKYLGMNKGLTINVGQPLGNISTSVLMITSDQFLSLTGEIGFNGYIIKKNNDNLISFTSGFLTSYNFSCGLGEIPNISTNISVYGDIGSLTRQNYDLIRNDPAYLNNPEYDYIFNDFAINEAKSLASDSLILPGSVSILPLNIISSESIEITTDTFNTNRVSLCNVGLNVQRLSQTALGMEFPLSIDINYPIEITCSFDMDMNEYSAYALRSNSIFKNIGINIRNFETDAVIQSFSFNNMELVSQTCNPSLDEFKVNLQFKGYILR